MIFGDCVIITSNGMLGIVLDRILPTSINNYMNAYLIVTMERLILVEPSHIKSLGYSITEEI